MGFVGLVIVGLLVGFDFDVFDGDYVGYVDFYVM